MRLQLLATGFLVVLVACSTPTTPQTIQGKVNKSIASGSGALAGASVTIRAGNESKTATTDASGAYSIELSAKPTTFSITVEPSSSSGFGSITYDQLPFEAYASEFGAADQLNFYLPGGTPASLGGFPPRFGCIGGTLSDGGNPVVSTPLATQPPNRTSPAACDGSVPSNLLLSSTGLRTGENGLVLFGGLRAVYSKAGGNYLLPVVTTNNGWAFSGSLWAGNYIGRDNPNADLANEFYWDKFVHVPQTEVFLNSTTQTQNLALEAFNPTTNPSKVTTLKVSHDTSALSGFNFADPNQALSLSAPSFEHAITSGGIDLGLYFDFRAGARNLRVPKLQTGKQGQQIQVLSVALNDDGAESDVIFWRDGTNLGTEVKADFLGIPTPQAPTNNATGVNRKPSLSWKAVNKARLYEVDILDGTKLVWYGITDKTSLNLPITLQANKKHIWQVIAFDQLTITDAVGLEPAALQVPLGLKPDHPKLAVFKNNPFQVYRTQLAQTYAALGYRPNLEFGGINLKSAGYRVSASEGFAFTTGQ